ncbi:MAG: tetratricopeptide repeat protein [Thermodesulfobacteriota bacterium]
MADSPAKSRTDKLSGVFSTQEVKKVGTGATQRRTKAKQYWLVNELDGDQAEIQPINENLIPIGKKRVIRLEDLLERFEPEPEFYVHTGRASPEALRELRERKADGTVEIDLEGFDLTGSPEDVEKSARSSFGLGLTYLKRGNREKAEDIFRRLAEVKADFAPEHKHMFNDFGISLRKQSLLDLAVMHYLRALDLAGNDENLHHNIARAYFEKKDFTAAIKALEMSLAINPDLKESRKFLRYIRRARDKEGAGPGPLVIDI